MTIMTLSTAYCVTVQCCAYCGLLRTYLLITAQCCALTAGCCAGAVLTADSCALNRYRCLMVPFLSDAGVRGGPELTSDCVLEE